MQTQHTEEHRAPNILCGTTAIVAAAKNGIKTKHSEENGIYSVFRALVTCAAAAAAAAVRVMHVCCVKWGSEAESEEPIYSRLPRVRARAKGVKYICIHRRSTSGARKIVKYVLTPCVCAVCTLCARPLANLLGMPKHFSTFIQQFFFSILFFSVSHNSIPFVCRFL